GEELRVDAEVRRVLRVRESILREKIAELHHARMAQDIVERAVDEHEREEQPEHERREVAVTVRVHGRGSTGVSPRFTPSRIGRGGPRRGSVTSAHNVSPAGRMDGSGTCSGMKNG